MVTCLEVSHIKRSTQKSILGLNGLKHTKAIRNIVVLSVARGLRIGAAGIDIEGKSNVLINT